MYENKKPTKKPKSVYPKVPGIDYDKIVLKPEGMTEKERKEALAMIAAYEKKQHDSFLGYQANQAVDFQEDLSQYMNYHVNNVGDPFVEGNFTVNSKFAERAVLDYFAALWHANWPHENAPRDTDSGEKEWLDSYWGYIVSMGCTEGNVYGMWNARDYLAGKFILPDAEYEERKKKASAKGKAFNATPDLMYYQAKTPDESPNAFKPIMFYSQDTHYSIVKASRVLCITGFNEAGSGKYDCPLHFPEDYPASFSETYLDNNGWPLEVPSNQDGTICIPALAKLVEFFAAKGHPILVCFDYGTTFKGAYDNVEEAVKVLVPILKRYHLYERNIVYDEKSGKYDTRTGYWFHVDGALGAAYAPFLEMLGKDVPKFDFRIPEVHSIAMSGHKWLGAPWPCGIYMTKVRYQLTPPSDPMYIGSPDSTFAGSRNGLSPLIMWDYLAKHSYDDLKKKAQETEDMATYSYNELKKLEKELGEDLWVEHTPYALTVLFKKANPDLVFKYSLSGEDLYINGKKRSYSHIYMMENATKERIDRLMADLRKPGAFVKQEEEEAPDVAKLPKANGTRGVYIPHSGRGFK